MDRIAETASAATSSVYGSSTDYFSMVRMMIENHKQYPYAARKRQIEGRVVLRFVIDSDGSAKELSVIGSSNYQILDEAALRAVRDSSPFPGPPEKFFKGPVTLEICLIFKLI
jgi:protein TonB